MISHFKATFHGGPLPSAEVLRELDEVYPDASKIIFEDFQAQSAHRREREREVVATKNLLAVRGQLIGGFLGMIGLIGSTIVAGLGQGLAGFGIAMLSVGSLVSVFVVGREAQKGERKEKAKLIEKIKRGDPIVALEEGDDPEKKPTKPPPTKRPPDSRTKTKTKKK